MDWGIVELRSLTLATTAIFCFDELVLGTTLDEWGSAQIGALVGVHLILRLGVAPAADRSDSSCGRTCRY